MYDSDIIVVGAGPAGLAAACRARVPRTYYTIPSSVKIIDNSSPGGLADWTKVRITGDRFSYEKGKIIEELEAEAEGYSIPILKEEVTEVKHHGEHISVVTKDSEYTCLSVVLATGMRRTWNESDFFGDRIFGTLKGYRFMENHYEKMCSEHAGKTIIFVGTEELDKTLDFFESINDGRLDVKRIYDCEEKVKGYKKEGDKMVVELDSDEIRGDLVHIDFESYMLSNWTCDITTLPRDKAGFLKIDDKCRVTEGVFAAGDITGPPFAVAKAVGQGVTAGLEAYRYVYSLKFGGEAPMYAFYPIHSGTGSSYFKIPEMKDDLRPKLLGEYSERGGELIFSDKVIEGNKFNRRLLELCDGRHHMSDIYERLEDEERAIEVIEELILSKHMTLEV